MKDKQQNDYQGCHEGWDKKSLWPILIYYHSACMEDWKNYKNLSYDRCSLVSI